jgi:hypothetical protein
MNAKNLVFIYSLHLLSDFHVKIENQDIFNTKKQEKTLEIKNRQERYEHKDFFSFVFVHFETFEVKNINHQ